MKKKMIAFLSVIVLCISMVFPVAAAETDGFADEYYRVNDLAGLLSEDEKTDLINKLDEISIRQKMDVAIAAVEDLDGYSSVQEYADVVYEYCKYGYGEDKDGLLLLISMEDHDWYITTCGYGITAFTDAGIEYIGKKILPDLSDGNYAGAFQKYADLCDAFITQARSGEPYDSGNLPKEALSTIWFPVAVGIGVLLAFVIVSRMKAQLHTVRAQVAANSYVKKNSMNITESQDLFLYHTVTRTAKPKEKKESSTHKSSSGTTHGGGGGKF